LPARSPPRIRDRLLDRIAVDEAPELREDRRPASPHDQDGGSIDDAELGEKRPALPLLDHVEADEPDVRRLRGGLGLARGEPVEATPGMESETTTTRWCVSASATFSGRPCLAILTGAACDFVAWDEGFACRAALGCCTGFA
jgi:hypothetical protein